MQTFLSYFIFISILTVFLATPASEASNRYRFISKDKKIVSALKLLEKSPQKWVIDVLKGENPHDEIIQVKFYNLSAISPKFRNYEALFCQDNWGQYIILINTKNKKAPVEAIASLLSHEAVHQDKDNSIEEEITAWTNEAITWNYLKKQNPELNNPSLHKHKLVRRLNRLEKMYLSANKTSNKIKKVVINNSAYKGLKRYSLGYGK